MCNRWMFSCSELLTNSKDRRKDLESLSKEGCQECKDWANKELTKDENPSSDRKIAGA